MNVQFSRLQLKSEQVQTLQDTKNENDMNCENTNETTTAMSHLHFISSARYSSLERTWVSTKQAKWEQGNLNFCGWSIPFLFHYCLVLMKIRSNWWNPQTNHWLMNFPTFLFVFILFIFNFIYLFFGTKKVGGQSPRSPPLARSLRQLFLSPKNFQDVTIVVLCFFPKARSSGKPFIIMKVSFICMWLA